MRLWVTFLEYTHCSPGSVEPPHPLAALWTMGGVLSPTSCLLLRHWKCDKPSALALAKEQWLGVVLWKPLGYMQRREEIVTSPLDEASSTLLLASLNKLKSSVGSTLSKSFHPKSLKFLKLYPDNNASPPKYGGNNLQCKCSFRVKMPDYWGGRATHTIWPSPHNHPLQSETADTINAWKVVSPHFIRYWVN